MNTENRIKLAWGNKVNLDFIVAVLGACLELRWPVMTHASWLMTCIAFETGGTFRTNIRNDSSGATGLIQIIESTARELGTTTAELANMTVSEQMRYVVRYFQPYAVRVKSLEDMYMAILMPKYVGKCAGEAVFTDGTLAYRQNSGFDTDHDGVITMFEITDKIRKRHIQGLTEANLKEI